MEFYDKSPDDVAFVADGIGSCSWEIFAYLANELDYSNGYGAQEINPNLVIMFNDTTWLTRYEYDGSEGWIGGGIPPKPPPGRITILY